MVRWEVASGIARLSVMFLAMLAAAPRITTTSSEAAGADGGALLAAGTLFEGATVLVATALTGFPLVSKSFFQLSSTRVLSCWYCSRSSSSNQLLIPSWGSDVAIYQF